jgi:cardiolipin synthase
VSIPNFLSLFRIILVPVTVILLIDGSFSTALAIFTLAGVTDALDGFLARVLSQKTVLGAYLDPIADKALLTSCFVTLSILGIIPGWLTVIVVSRDFIILFGISIFFMASVPFEIRPIFVSKVTTAVQIITVFLALAMKTLGGDGHPLLIHSLHWLTAGFTTISGFHYILRGIKAINNS